MLILQRMSVPRMVVKPRPNGPDASARPPIILVILDTLRADMLYRRDLLGGLPTMRKLFEQSYLFTRAYSPSHWTLPSHASLFTGLTPNDHMAHPPHMRLRSDVPTIAEVFRRRGYLTACITCNPWLSETFGMTRGFDIVWRPRFLSIAWSLNRAADHLAGSFNGHNGVVRTTASLAKLLAAIILSSPAIDNGARSLTRGLRRIVRGEQAPPFLVINLMEAHGPYHGRGGFSGWRKRIRHQGIFGRWERLKFAIMGGRLPITEGMRRDISGIYWENVRYLDSQLGILLRNLPDGFLDRGFLIFVSDHGQLLGERGGIDHSAGLNEELIHVPLAIRPPGGDGGFRVDRPMDITWIYFLLSAIASGERDPLSAWLRWLDNQDAVISVAHGGTVPYVDRLRGRDPHFIEDLLAFKTRHDHPALACIQGRWKLICHLGRQEDELYDLTEDPQELVSIVKGEKDVLEDLHEKLRERFLNPVRNPPGHGYRDGLPLEAKKAIAKIVLTKALGAERKPVLVWTGGKDSTLVLYLTLEVASREGLKVPPILIIDHGQHFQETWSFAEEIAQRTGLQIITARNEDLLAAAGEGVETVPLESLDLENQEEALKAGLEGTEVPLSLDTSVGNHLLKTVALKRALRENGFETVITGIRWDENPARSDEVFFSPREDPPHMRVHPILPWTEREVWDYTLESELPIHPLYSQGYRSFDGVKDSKPTDTRPAWEQDLEASAERAGRAQDKEEIMKRLRALGYF